MGFSVAVTLQSEQQPSSDDQTTYENGPNQADTLAQQLARWIADCPLPCHVDMGLSEKTLKDNGVTRSEFVFVATLALGRAAYYEVMSYGQPKENTFKEDTFTYHLCKQPQFRKVWDILWPMWGRDEAFVQMMNQTIREIEEMKHT